MGLALKTLPMKHAASRRKVLVGLAALVLVPALDACGGGDEPASSTNGSGLASSVWPKYRGNLGNTGMRSGFGANGNLRWRTVAGASGRVEGSAIIGPEGTVYIGADDGKVYAFQGVTGAILWATRVQSAGVDSTPVLDANGSLYVGAGLLPPAEN